MTSHPPRTNVYYWKCDNPLPLEERRIYNDKYEHADISEEVKAVAESFFGQPVLVNSTGSAGNHYAYTLDVGNERYFFRAADGRIDDDYMLAESAVMRLLSKHGVPVPEVLTVDVTKSEASFRYQILEWRPEPCLNVFYQNDTLDHAQVGRQLGEYLARMHSVSRPGFGFVNTATLAESGEIQGLDQSHQTYFLKNLDIHLSYLRDNDLLNATRAREIEERITSLAYLTELEKGGIVHRDIALWNILGERDRITAVIDWDDVVIGDPADDFGILGCFYDSGFITHVKDGYSTVCPLPEALEVKMPLYTLRNMLWKAMIRHYMGYFEQTGNFFILNADNRASLRDFTLGKIDTALAQLKGV
jgi:aminoglycoside phosphotransferase (APT) family kinase protein